jgi:transposase-like protein/transposase
MGHEHNSGCQREHYGAEHKLSVLRQGFRHDAVVADLCRREGISRTTYYEWRKRFLHGGTDRFRAESLKAENHRLREALRFMIVGGHNRKNSLLSDQDIGPVCWMLRLMQNAYPLSAAENELGQVAGLSTLLEDAVSPRRRKRNYAISILAQSRGIRRSTIARFLHISRSSVYRHWLRFETPDGAVSSKRHQYRTIKADDEANIAAVFSVLHSPPSEFGINRTSWRMADLQKCIGERGVFLGQATIRRIVKAAGYTWRRAKVVLTSNDPLYRQKLKRIQAVLSSLREDERFFSIDEFGPFAVKMKGGRKLVAPNEYPSVPQFQKSKGWLILTAALELSSNQVTHFYSPDKNTDEMIRLLDVILAEYRGCRRIYLSWDAASWHISNKLKQRVFEINAQSYRREHNTPMVELAPLPASAQFLNVIESVFSGMARAIIHNSNYGSVDEVRSAIDRHFKERNESFKEHPKPAGKKVWGREPSQPQFNEANNCKDSRFR